jgi:hypothetical protein
VGECLRRLAGRGGEGRAMNIVEDVYCHGDRPFFALCNLTKIFQKIITALIEF